MLCDVILTFVVTFSDGHKENRTKWMDQTVARQFVEQLPYLKNMLKDGGITNVDDVKITPVPPYDCSKGPQ